MPSHVFMCMLKRWNISDFLREAPDILFHHLSETFKAFLVHGHVGEDLLLAALVPLVKDRLGDICSSSNYRSIAISSIILKLLDCIILKAYGYLVQLYDLQFRFQEKDSTSLCSWFLYEMIEHYIQNGSNVYGVLMDENTFIPLTALKNDPGFKNLNFHT